MCEINQDISTYTNLLLFPFFPPSIPPSSPPSILLSPVAISDTIGAFFTPMQPSPSFEEIPVPLHGEGKESNEGAGEACIDSKTQDPVPPAAHTEMMGITGKEYTNMV